MIIRRLTVILLLRPLPKHLDEEAVVDRISPEKDLDGISPVNLAKVFAGDKTGFAPCTAEAVVEMLDFAGIDVTGKRVTVVGRSLVIGKPVSMLLLKKNATVTICHTKTKDMKEECRRADILVAAAGVAKMINAEYVGKGAVVIDVGINVDNNGKLCGDVDTDGISSLASVATPVPGGVRFGYNIGACKAFVYRQQKKTDKKLQKVKGYGMKVAICDDSEQDIADLKEKLLKIIEGQIENCEIHVYTDVTKFLKEIHTIFFLMEYFWILICRR